MNTSEESFLIKITGQDYHFEQKIDSLQRSKIVSFLNIPSQPSITPVEVYDENLPVVVSSNNTSSYSPSEYLLQKNATTNPQKIAVFLMYVEDVLFQASAGKEQIKDLFEKSKQNMPTNFTRDFDQAIRFGWISGASDGGKYYLTVTGRSAIEKGFSVIDNKNRRTVNHKNVKKKVKTEIREEIEKLDVNNSQNLKEYWKLNKGDKILWLLTVADNQGITDVNFKELSRLATKKHDNILAKSITALLSSHEKNNRVVSPLVGNVRKLKILKLGIDYITNNAG